MAEKNTIIFIMTGVRDCFTSCVRGGIEDHFPSWMIPSYPEENDQCGGFLHSVASTTNETKIYFGKAMYEKMMMQGTDEYAIKGMLQKLSKKEYFMPCNSQTCITIQAPVIQVLNFFCDPTLYSLFKGTYEMAYFREMEDVPGHKVLSWTLKKHP